MWNLYLFEYGQYTHQNAGNSMVIMNIYIVNLFELIWKIFWVAIIVRSNGNLYEAGK